MCATQKLFPTDMDACDDKETQDMMRKYKVAPCPKRFPHDWSACTYYHPREKARRRDPRKHQYTGVACPSMRQFRRCELGDGCPFSHNVFEFWLHPSRYRTQLCNDGGRCQRKLCFFAHSIEQLRSPSCQPVEQPGQLLRPPPAAAAQTQQQAGSPPPQRTRSASPPSLRSALLSCKQQQAQLAWQAQQQDHQAAAQLALAGSSVSPGLDPDGLLIAQQVADLLSRGQLPLASCAAILQQLVPPAAPLAVQGLPGPLHASPFHTSFGDLFAQDCDDGLAQPLRWSDPGMSLSSTSQPGSPPDRELLAGSALKDPAAALPQHFLAAGPPVVQQLPAVFNGSGLPLGGAVGSSVLGWDSTSSLESDVAGLIGAAHHRSGSGGSAPGPPSLASQLNAVGWP